MNKSNKVVLEGSMVNDFVLDHERKGVKYYTTTVTVERTSGIYDNLIVVAPETLENIKDVKANDFVRIEGEFRSINLRYDDSSKKLKLYVYAKKISYNEYYNGMINDTNSVNLTGYICKKPVYRKTPLGKEITDIVIAVNREYNSSDYIPLILWGSLAKKAEKFEIGKKISIAGRIQSRSYQKKFDDEKVENRTAYEVSVSTMKEESED